nr:Chain A, BH26 peptide [synthetic construct]
RGVTVPHNGESKDYSV